MRRFFAIALMMVSSATALGAQVIMGSQPQYQWKVASTAVTGQQGKFISFTGMRGPIPGSYSMQWVVSGTAPSVCTFTLQGSNDGLVWVNLDGGTVNCTTSGIEYIVSKPVTSVRVNLVSFTAGDTTTALTFNYSGSTAAGAAPPSGPAGGVLSGNYPNPGFAASVTTVLYKLTVPISNTASGTTENNIASYQMPAATMGANSVLKIHFYGLGSGGAGTCTFKIRYGTNATPTSNLAVATSIVGAANRGLEILTTLANAGATNSQTISSIATASTNSLTDTGTTSAIDTTAISYIGLTAQNSVAADNCAVTEADILLEP